MTTMSGLEDDHCKDAGDQWEERKEQTDLLSMTPPTNPDLKDKAARL